ncbi:MAG: class I SAM-dependent methyltransferase [Natronosporangium sp.]
MSSSDLWSETDALQYDQASAFMFQPDVLVPAVDLLAELAAAGPALEFAIGTGRVAIPLAERGVRVAGIDLSPSMIEELHRKVDPTRIPASVGDMATTRVEGQFTLVFVVWNSIGNVRTQDEQARVFANAAAHLAPGGRFLVELGIPPIRRLPPGQSAAPFHVGRNHTGFDTYDLVTQQGTSHHYWRSDDDTVTYRTSNFRYLWPSECDLMARLAGMERESRWVDFRKNPFTGDSEAHVSVWRKPGAGPS